MEDQKDVSDKGGTMRLGNWKCELTEGSKINNVYKKNREKARNTKAQFSIIFWEN